MQFIDAPSPNHNERGRAVDTVILHYTGMKTGAEALERLCDPASKVSAHYLIEEDGQIFRLVDENARAWHAGVSSWKGEIDINARSIGVELVNPGHEFGYRDFPEIQIDALVALLKDIRTRHDIPPARVLGHSDVAPERKTDPGEKFPWTRLAAEGLALAPYDGPPDDNVALEDALAALEFIGYNLGNTQAAVVRAFQRRFCPAALGKGFDPLTKAALIAVAAELRAA
ncbi:MAG: N-acetylmuramoyl-L-alanine amidase [Parvularculaceae bacterium]